MIRLAERLLLLCALMCGHGWLPVAAQEEDAELDFTAGDLETIGPIKAEAEKPQVSILPRRVDPEFHQFELQEHSFLNEVLQTANHQELNKKLRKKTFTVQTAESVE